MGTLISARTFEIDEPGMPVGLVVKKAEILGCGFDKIIERLSCLGLGDSSLPSPSSVGKTNATDVVLLSENLDGRSPWLANGKLVGLGNLVAASVRTQLSPARAKRRLMDFGFEVELAAELAAPLDTSDLRLMSTRLDSQQPWLDLSAPVSSLHIASAAYLGRQPFVAVATHLTQLGFTLSNISCDPEEIDNVDSRVRSAVLALSQRFPQLLHDQPFLIVRAAARARCSPASVGRFLATVGVDLRLAGPLPRELDDSTGTLVNLLSSDFSISLKDLISVSAKVNVSLKLVVDRMLALGAGFNFLPDSLVSLDETDRRIVASLGIYLKNSSLSTPPTTPPHPVTPTSAAIRSTRSTRQGKHSG